MITHTAFRNAAVDYGLEVTETWRERVGYYNPPLPRRKMSEVTFRRKEGRTVIIKVGLIDGKLYVVERNSSNVDSYWSLDDFRANLDVMHRVNNFINRLEE